ncbi:MAG: glycine cleavage system aminomethyltransferase GcvT [Parasphingopyxis sp.]|nr:glycine cleavage system aminomethyltransferase GcvT [Sphingomonadales bacterium]
MSEDKRLPLDDWHRARGARMVPFAGYAMPIQYAGILAEHRQTRQSAGLFDVSHMGQLSFTGDDVPQALETMLPGDIAGLAEGRMRYSLLLNDAGGIVDDLMVTNRGEDFYLVVNGANKASDIAHIERRLPEPVAMRELADHALLALQGPKAVDALARHVPGVERLYFMQAGGFDFGGTRLWVSRSGYTGEDGFEISVPVGAAVTLAEAIAGEAEVEPAGLGARDSLRLEAGLPLHGHDIDEETTPVTADLGFALSKRRREAADFPGADRILAEREEGPVARRVGVEIEGRQPVREGAVVLDEEGSAVGRITSGGFSPTLERPIAMGYVPLAAAEPGNEITIEQRGKLFTGRVAKMPFVPHNYHRPPKS